MIVETWKATILVNEALSWSRDNTHYFQIDLPIEYTTVIPPRLYRIVTMFLSVKLAAFCRLIISSILGCRHVPVTGVARAEGACGSLVGVEG